MSKQLNDQIKNILDPEYKRSYWMSSNKTVKRRIQALKEKNINKNQNRWTLEQNQKYMKFIEKFHKLFKTDQRQKKYRIFNKMALFVKTRDSIQCRTHHQKMIKKYLTFQNILDRKEQFNRKQSCSQIKQQQLSNSNKQQDPLPQTQKIQSSPITSTNNQTNVKIQDLTQYKIYQPNIIETKLPVEQKNQNISSLYRNNETSSEYECKKQLLGGKCLGEETKNQKNSICWICLRKFNQYDRNQIFRSYQRNIVYPSSNLPFNFSFNSYNPFERRLLCLNCQKNYLIQPSLANMEKRVPYY